MSNTIDNEETPRRAYSKEELLSKIGGFTSELKKQNRAAFLFFISKLIGQNVEVGVANGSKYSGTLYTCTPYAGRDFDVVLRSVRRINESTHDGEDIESGSTLLIPGNDLITINASKLDIKLGKDNEEFQTDAAISRGVRDLTHLEGRDLQSIDTTWLAADTHTSFGSEGNTSSSSSSSAPHWDQFETNRRLYNVQSTYDENIYTKKLDRNALTKEQIALADRMAKEIEASQSSNIHLREERGQAIEREVDEEFLYSGVYREAEYPPLAPPPYTSATSSPIDNASTASSWRRGLKVTKSPVTGHPHSTGKQPQTSSFNTRPSQTSSSQQHISAILTRPGGKAGSGNINRSERDPDYRYQATSSAPPIHQQQLSPQHEYGMLRTDNRSSPLGAGAPPGYDTSDFPPLAHSGSNGYNNSSNNSVPAPKQGMGAPPGFLSRSGGQYPYDPATNNGVGDGYGQRSSGSPQTWDQSLEGEGGGEGEAGGEGEGEYDDDDDGDYVTEEEDEGEEEGREAGFAAENTVIIPARKDDKGTSAAVAAPANIKTTSGKLEGPRPPVSTDKGKEGVGVVEVPDKDPVVTEKQTASVLEKKDALNGDGSTNNNNSNNTNSTNSSTPAASSSSTVAASEEKKPPSSSSLNPNAKPFSFNPTAPSFEPGGFKPVAAVKTAVIPLPTTPASTGPNVPNLPPVTPPSIASTGPANKTPPTTDRRLSMDTPSHSDPSGANVHSSANYVLTPTSAAKGRSKSPLQFPNPITTTLHTLPSQSHSQTSLSSQDSGVSYSESGGPPHSHHDNPRHSGDARLSISSQGSHSGNKQHHTNSSGGNSNRHSNSNSVQHSPHTPNQRSYSFHHEDQQPQQHQRMEPSGGMMQAGGGMVMAGPGPGMHMQQMLPIQMQPQLQDPNQMMGVNMQMQQMQQFYPGMHMEAYPQQPGMPMGEYGQPYFVVGGTPMHPQMMMQQQPVNMTMAMAGSQMMMSPGPGYPHGVGVPGPPYYVQANVPQMMNLAQPLDGRSFQQNPQNVMSPGPQFFTNAMGGVPMQQMGMPAHMSPGHGGVGQPGHLEPVMGQQQYVGGGGGGGGRGGRGGRNAGGRGRGGGRGDSERRDSPEGGRGRGSRGERGPPSSANSSASLTNAASSPISGGPDSK